MSEPLLIDDLLQPGKHTCLVVKATFSPVGDVDRFQPAGFPEIGHVLYDAPRGQDGETESVCIIDSAASLANHLESLCFLNADAGIVHPEVEGIPFVRAVTDGDDGGKDTMVTTTWSEGHRLASDYFLDGKLGALNFRDLLRKGFGVKEIKKDKTYFFTPNEWWSIYNTIFAYDPNSLVHGVLFAKEQIKIARVLTASLEAYGASRVGSSGVKFDRLGKTTSGQPIFSRDEETAREIRGTFIIDLAQISSYGYTGLGLASSQKRLLLEFALWKIARLLATPFRFRSGCFLSCIEVKTALDGGKDFAGRPLEKPFALDLKKAIAEAGFKSDPVTDVYYPAKELYKEEKEDKAAKAKAGAGDEEEPQGES